MSSVDQWRMELNNYLQRSQQTGILSWEVTSSGPPHARIWTAVAYIRGVEYGHASASTSAGAKEEAARQTLSALRAERAGY
ncbi:hypothetical protein GLOTRDRAFT_128008 [Gloeophyllum trabeum ATCC 11539]|uniref:DRBM domain-containing protein n=1 Tax=Gloeophyllum trabeum (strain ATCC 11539 / FP-39264 / Madison 617) TaxID=670483 RepID=S7QCP6_GLOTA|nr:uncharacterized protein GLOTRDRAFT_128008 [Gloeophyllum trabeum ATCC 11539]EPQ57651.1 hypothetical protein GLOTRDRAFT_128008 [Gloeophyllum trabeum ATCC 11539]